MAKKFTAVAGFDGFVDKIVRVVNAYNGDEKVYFKDIAQFLSALNLFVGKSGELEIISVETRLGGNTPIMSNALAGLGADITLVGTVDHAVFEQLHPNIKKISFGAPGDVLALEFGDGKIMLGDMTDMNTAITSVKNNSELLNSITEPYSHADLCALTSWSMMRDMHALWAAAISKIKKRDDNPIIFMDTSDFSKRSCEDILMLMNLIKSLDGFEAYLGLNEKETLLIAEKLGDKKKSVEDASDLIHKISGCNIIAHGIGYCTYTGTYRQLTAKGKTAEFSKTSTGAGDHFNAAWCYAIMQEYTIPQAMEYANQFAHDYVSGNLVL